MLPTFISLHLPSASLARSLGRLPCSFAVRLLALLIVAVMIVSYRVDAANPIITDVYTADPAALVHDGRVYLYTGHDEGSTSYVMRDWLCFSSSDMVNWRSEDSPLSLSAFSWARQDAWAGQVIERGGKFYYYVPMSHRTITGFAIGVAVADQPTGPFVDARGTALITNDMTANTTGITWDDIDPTVFIDDDGQAYLYWGNTVCHYVKLKPNMIEIDGSIQTVTLPLFTEAPWVHKRNGIYYLSYAYGWEEKIAYATSSSITGPWTYRGVINDYVYNCNTNHQAIIEFKGQSYFIYHNGGAPGGGSYRRSVCIDYLNYNADGTIVPIVQTAAGVGRATAVITPPATQAVALGASATFSVAAVGDGTLTYQWRKNGTAIAGATSATYTVANVQAADTGFYSVTVSDANRSINSDVAILTVNAGSSRLTGLSTRGLVPAGGDLTYGFFLGGSGNKAVVTRGVGPTLGNYGIASPLSDPKMDLIPAGGSTPQLSNDDWGTNTNLPALRAAMPFPLVEGSKDAAALATLSTATNAGYTVRVTPSGTATSGIALAEVYDLDAATAPMKFASLSTRGFSGTGENVLTVGFFISGDGPKQLLIRAVGPTLGAPPYNVPGVLADPQFRVVPLGLDLTVAANDNWGGTTALQAAFAQTQAFSLPANSQDAAAIVRLPPGGYTVQATGTGGTTGTVLVEVYDMDP